VKIGLLKNFNLATP